jgi:sarcosine oxidase, subunit beta
VIKQADAVVIGGGILGASVAHFLTKNDVGSVVLLEKNRICTGATAYSAANVRQHYSNEVGIRLAVRAVEMFSNAEQELGGPAGFVRCGYMVIAAEGQEDALRKVVPLQRSFGVETELLTPDEIRARYPDLDLDGIALGALESTSGYANPLETVTSLVRSAERQGLRVHEGTEVLDIVVGDGSIEGVVTGEGKIATPVVVNAAGPWAARVGAMAGVDYQLSLSREHEVVVALPEGCGPFPIVSDPANSIFFRPYGPDKVLVGEGYPKEQEPCDPDTYNARADEPVIERMLTRLAKRMPRLVNLQRVLDYAGVYSITADWYPIVGSEPGIHGYYAAVGGSGHSFKIGPPIGEALADVIAGREPTIDISALDHTRFTRDAVFGSVWGPGNRA